MEYHTPRGGKITLRAFDPGGRVRARETWTVSNAGSYLRSWTARDASGRALRSGAYWLRLDTPSGAETIRWTVLR